MKIIARKILFGIVGMLVSMVVVADSTDQPYLSAIQSILGGSGAQGSATANNTTNNLQSMIGSLLTANIGPTTPNPNNVPILPILNLIGDRLGVQGLPVPSNYSTSPNVTPPIDKSVNSMNTTLNNLLSYFQNAASNNAPGANGNFADQMQNLKDFLAMTFLKYRSWEIDNGTMPPPSFQDNLWVARKISDGTEVVSSTVPYLSNLYAGWNLYAPTDQTSSAAMILRHITLFCGSLDMTVGGICNWNPTQTISATDTRATMRDPMPGDYLASSLIGTTTLVDPTAVFIAREYIRNLTAAQPVPMIPPGKMFDDPNDAVGSRSFTDSGIANLTALYQYQTYSTLAQEPLFAMLAERIAFPTNTSPSGMPAEISGQSLLETMRYEASHRYTTPQWHIEMNKMSLEGVMREIADMMAFQNYMQFQNYLNTERILALQAANMGVYANTIAQGERGRQNAAAAQ